ARSVVRLAQRSMVLSLVEGEAPPNARCQRIGPALLFERLWHEVGCRAVLEELAASRQFEFAAERAVFLTVLHRLFVSGSDSTANPVSLAQVECQCGGDAPCQAQRCGWRILAAFRAWPNPWHNKTVGPLPQTGVIGFKSTGSATRHTSTQDRLHRTCRCSIMTGTMIFQRRADMTDRATPDAAPDTTDLFEIILS